MSAKARACGAGTCQPTAAEAALKHEGHSSAGQSRDSTQLAARRARGFLTSHQTLSLAACAEADTNRPTEMAAVAKEAMASCSNKQVLSWRSFAGMAPPCKAEPRLPSPASQRWKCCDAHVHVAIAERIHSEPAAAVCTCSSALLWRCRLMYSFMHPIAPSTSIVMTANTIIRAPFSGSLWFARCSIASALVMKAIATNCKNLKQIELLVLAW